MAGAPLTLAAANDGDRMVGRPSSTAEAGRAAGSVTTAEAVTASTATTAAYLEKSRRTTGPV